MRQYASSRPWHRQLPFTFSVLQHRIRGRLQQHFTISVMLQWESAEKCSPDRSRSGFSPPSLNCLGNAEKLVHLCKLCICSINSTHFIMGSINYQVCLSACQGTRWCSTGSSSGSFWVLLLREWSCPITFRLTTECTSLRLGEGSELVKPLGE